MTAYVQTRTKPNAAWSLANINNSTILSNCLTHKQNFLLWLSKQKAEFFLLSAAAILEVGSFPFLTEIKLFLVYLIPLNGIMFRPAVWLFSNISPLATVQKADSRPLAPSKRYCSDSNKWFWLQNVG